MKLAELATIKAALEGLGKQKLPIWYEIAKNLKAVNKVLNDANEVRQDLWNKYADKVEGTEEVKEYIGEAGTPEAGKPYTKITDKADLKECMAQMKAMDEDDSFTVNFHRILASRVSAKDLEGLYGEPLIDVVFVETEAELKAVPTPKAEAPKAEAA
jgi:hypothetical protein